MGTGGVLLRVGQAVEKYLDAEFIFRSWVKIKLLWSFVIVILVFRMSFFSYFLVRVCREPELYSIAKVRILYTITSSQFDEKFEGSHIQMVNPSIKTGI